MTKAAGLRFVGIREFKEGFPGVIKGDREVVVTRRGKPVARVVPIVDGSPEDLLLEIGMVLAEAGVSKEEALKALKAAGRAAYEG